MAVVIPRPLDRASPLPLDSGAMTMKGACEKCGAPLAPDAEGMAVDPAMLTGWHRGHLPELLGIRFVHATKDRVVAELTIRDELTTVGGRLHGGTIMALADTVGATATALNLPPGASTTTLESKTNFFAGGRAGVVRAESTPLHRGGRTMVWQTRVTDESGKLLALTVQTQIVLT